MKGAVGLILFGLLLFSVAPVATAQSSDSAATSTQTPADNQRAQSAIGGPALPPGTAILAVLDKSINAKKAKAGDEVRAKVVQDVLVAGNVAIPRNSKLIGRIQDVKAAEDKDSQSSVALAFDKAVLKNQQEIALTVVIQALAAPPRMNMATGPMASDDMGASAPSGGMGPGPNVPATGRPGEQVTGPGGGHTTGGPIGGTSGATAGDIAPAPGMNNSATLSANARGVMGLPGITIASEAGTRNVSIVTGSKGNVKLEGGTQMVLRVSQ